MGETKDSAALAVPFGSFSQILADNAERLRSQPALRDEHGEVSWAALADRVERIAARLLECGLERGQSVAILGTSSVAYALVFLAAVRAGGVAAPLTTSATAAQLAGMAEDSGARHIFIDRAKLSELGDACFPDMTRIVLDEELDGWMAPQGTSTPMVEHRPADPFNIIYSSGTTGTPKALSIRMQCVGGSSPRPQQAGSTMDWPCAAWLRPPSIRTPPWSPSSPRCWLAARCV